MKILVFDTCLDKMYVTLSEDDKILSSEVVTNKDNKYHSAFLISTIKDVLKKNNLSPKDIYAIGTNIGPGSFTGIRACTTVARMIAQQLNLICILKLVIVFLSLVEYGSNNFHLHKNF